MLHLVSIRLLLTVYAFVVIAAYAVALRAGFVSDASWTDIVAGILKVATPVAVSAIILALLAWRWLPSFIRNALFPYLGGQWAGTIEFEDASGALTPRKATLEVAHTLTSIQFALSTEESTSETLLVHARRVSVLGELVKLVYVYEVERREGFPGAGDRYRGCAFLDVRLTPKKIMTGNYFAGPKRRGVMRMALVRHNPFWKFWR